MPVLESENGWFVVEGEMQLFSEFCNEFIELQRNIYNRRSVRIENLWRAELEKKYFRTKGKVSEER